MNYKFGEGKKFVIVAHCLLNPNAKVFGLSNDDRAGNMICDYIRKGVGIIQLPCIEMDVCGVMRWGHVKDQFDYPLFRSRCRELLTPIINQVEDYLKHGYECLGIIGVDGSPTCGISKTEHAPWYGNFDETNDYEAKIKLIEYVEESGVMIEVLKAMLLERNLSIPMSAIEENSNIGRD